MTLVAPRDYQPSAVHSLPAFFAISSGIPLPDGRVVLNAISYTESSLGLPLHLLDASGSRVRSFGADPIILGEWDAGVFSRKLALARNGSVWSAPLNRYVIEQWDTAGKLVRRFQRTVEWFPDVEEVNRLPNGPDDPPTAHMAGLWEDDGGRLWVVVNVPVTDWIEYLETYIRHDGVERYRIATFPEAVYRARIEVLSSETGELLAAGEGPLGVASVIQGGYAVTPVLVQDEPHLQIWRLGLREREGG
jgi:hypothetical protein